jgi:hypothetical protein
MTDETNPPMSLDEFKKMRDQDPLVQKLLHAADEAATQALADSVTHACPSSGSSVMPCCGRLPFEVPTTDRITVSGVVTCGELTDEDWQIWHAIHTVRIHRDYDLAWAAVQNAFKPFIDGMITTLNAIAAFIDVGATKAQRRAERKAARNAAEYSQPWAPGVITKKRRRR